MRKKIKKYFYGGINGAPPGILNGSTQPGYSPTIGGATPGYASTGSTGINAGVGVVLQGLGSQLGGSFNGELGNAIGLIGGNLSSNILSAGNLKDGLRNFADLDLFGKSNMSTFGTKDFKGFGNMGNLAMGIGSGILDRSTSHQRTSGKYGSLASGVDQIGGMLGNFGNYGGYSALGQLGMSAVNKITGGTDGMTVADSLLGSSSLAGGLTAINPIAGAGYIALSGLNSATGKTTTKNANNDFQSKEELATLWSSYSKSQKDHQNALQYGGKKYGGISRLTGSFGRADRKVRNDNARTDTLMNIYDRADLGRIRGEQMADINSLDYRLNTFGGYDQYGTRIGRKGMKLPTKQDVDRVKNILSCKKGGQMNVIPEGALHARKNHMEGAGKDYTHKGIPVMDKNGEQQAEIERNEIIFSLEVTQKLERLKNDGSDEAAIKAGKLLVDEIFHNTDDRTGLIQEIISQQQASKGIFKEGGIIKAEEPIIGIEAEEPINEEEIKEFQEGGVLEEGDNAITAEQPEVYEIEEFQKGGNVPSREEYISQKIRERTEAAIKKATTRKTPYMFKNKNWKNCIATATDNFGIPIVMRNSDLASDPNKWGFEEIFFGDNTDTLPDGVLLQDYNKPNHDYSVPGHTIMLVGRTETGAPIYSYSSGDNTSSAMHNQTTNYGFEWNDKIKPRAYRYIGTPSERKAWNEEYDTLYNLNNND